jgi:hypothetical protein
MGRKTFYDEEGNKVNLTYDDDGQPYIDDQPVKLSRDGSRAYSPRRKEWSAHPSTDYTVPHRTRRGWVMDVIWLGIIVLIFIVIFVIMNWSICNNLFKGVI